MIAASCRGACSPTASASGRCSPSASRGTAGALVGAALAPSSFALLLVALFVAGMLGASATGASGRAVMGWFARGERGFALGIRQMALPIGGALAALDAAGARARRRPARGAARLAAFTPRRRDRRRAAGCASRPPRPTPAGLRRAAADARRRGSGASASARACSSWRRRRSRLRRALPPRRARPVAGARPRSCSPRSSSPARSRASRRPLVGPPERRIAPLRHAGAARGAVLVALAALLAGAPSVVLVPSCSSPAAPRCRAGTAWRSPPPPRSPGRARAGTAMSLQNTLVSVARRRRARCFGFARRGHVAGRLAFAGHRGRARSLGWWVLRAARARGGASARRPGARRLRRVRCPAS